MTRVIVRLGDITALGVDAIVNAANSSLMGGGGVDGAIHRAGGPSIVDECRAIVARQGSLATGDAVVTGAGLLPCRYVIHTVGPVWRGDSDPAAASHQDAELASCYTTSLDRAAEVGARTVAFPNVSTGVYGYPKPRAATVSVGAVVSWSASNPGVIDEVTLVCFDRDNLDLVRAQVSEPAAESP